ncbi:MAG: hypothetical protein H8E14_01125 [Candidatus Marinimicrobia bacterium]|nr:hypothetical protein [Candidatus Neomarinimicrobiota bacterium]
MKINGLVRLWFYLAFSISVLLSKSGLIWIVYFGLWCGLLFFNRSTVRSIWWRLRPYLIFLPLMVILYTIFSLFLTTNNLTDILIQGGFALVKMLLMIAIMGIYFENSESGEIFNALRSLWQKSKLPWRWVEDFFMFLELTLRFFPAFQRDWEHLHQSRQALGLSGSLKRLAIIKQTAAYLPGLLLQSLRQADNTALSIKLRGYGNRIPRGIVFPVKFSGWDALVFLIVTLFFYWGNFVAQV